jgi:hypothetical protein
MSNVTSIEDNSQNKNATFEGTYTNLETVTCKKGMTTVLTRYNSFPSSTVTFTEVD